MINLVEKKSAADVAASNYASLCNKEGTTAIALAAAKTALDDAIKEYNKSVALNVQETCMAQEDPMAFAIKVAFQDVLRQKRKETDGIVEIDLDVVEGGAVIDLKALHVACVKAENVKSSHDARWVKYIPTVRKLFGIAVGKSLKDVDSDEAGYAFVKAELTERPDYIGRHESILDHAQIKEDSDPFSIGTLQEVLQLMADMIVGPDVIQIKRKHVRAMFLFIARGGVKLSYKMATDAAFAQVMYKVLHAALLNLDFKEDTN